MPTYVSLLRFTDKGSAAIGKTTDRARAFAKAAQRAGVQIEGQYWLMGEYDGLLILRADSVEPVRQVLSDLVAGGFVRTTTVPAFTADELARRGSGKMVRR